MILGRCPREPDSDMRRLRLMARSYLPLMLGRCPSDPGRDMRSGLWFRLSSLRFCRLLMAWGTVVRAQ